MTKTERIRNMLANQVPVPEIAKKVKVSASYVYALRKAEAKPKWQAKTVIVKDAAVSEPVAATPLDVQVGGDHYKGMKIQPIEFILANGLGFLEGCIVKRVSRWKMKGGVEDLEKIKHEVDLLIAAQQ